MQWAASLPSEPPGNYSMLSNPTSPFEGRDAGETAPPTLEDVPFVNSDVAKAYVCVNGETGSPTEARSPRPEAVLASTHHLRSVIHTPGSFSHRLFARHKSCNIIAKHVILGGSRLSVCRYRGSTLQMTCISSEHFLPVPCFSRFGASNGHATKSPRKQSWFECKSARGSRPWFVWNGTGHTPSRSDVSWTQLAQILDAHQTFAMQGFPHPSAP